MNANCLSGNSTIQCKFILFYYYFYYKRIFSFYLYLKTLYAIKLTYQLLNVSIFNVKIVFSKSFYYLMSKSSSLKKVFSEFDTNKATHSETADSLLYPEHEDYEYRRIRNAVICHGKLSKEDASAILLQKTYRMYRIRRYFANYYRQFQHVKKVTMRPYFIAFVLNSHATNCDRRKLYETQFSRTLFCNKIFKGYTHPPFEVFTVTDQCLLSPYIDSSVLSQFVKKFYHSLILKAFLEWRLIARKQVLDRKMRANKDIDIIKRHTFGNEFVCFNLWYRYTKRKLKKKMNANARIPQWDYYMNLIEKKNARYQKALEIRLTTIKKMAIQALLNRVIEKRDEENVLIDADKFRVKRNMLFALSAWAHYIVIRHNRVNTMRAILREWFCLIKQRIHFRSLLKKFEPRHSYFSKRAVFTAFMKNRQISQISSAYLYCKIQAKQSLALYFLAVLTHDDNMAPFYLAMHAWASFYRRRKKWQHFIFQDIKTSNYDTVRRKALSCLRKQNSTVLPLLPNFTSHHFQQETLYLYEYVMKMKTEYETIFLLSSDEEAKEAVANSTSTSEQRELFFKMWEGMKAEPTLMMRLAAINLYKRRAEKANENMKQGERTSAAYHKAVTFFESYNLASESKFQILRRTIRDNNKKALANRTRCIHRDQMIIYAHYSHFDAESLKEVKPLFMTNDKLRIVAKIKEATEELTNSYQYLVSIAGLGKSLNESNTHGFSELNGCRSPVKPFNIDHKTIQTKFMTQMKKGKISPITQIQFDRLMAGYVNDTSYKNLKTYQRMDPYAAPLIETKPPPVTGVNYRLLQMFPLKGRKPVKFSQKAKKKVNFNVFNNQKNEVEEEDVFEEEDDYFAGIVNIRKPGIIDSYIKSKGSMFFNSIKSFANIISQSSFSLFTSSASSLEMNTSSIIVPVEEVDEVGSSSSSSDNEQEQENEHVGQLHRHKPRRKVIGIAEDDVGEAEEKDDNEEMIDLKETHTFVKKEEENDKKPERKKTQLRGLNDGFDEELMKSINKSEPPKSPKASNKAKMFIEILFGRASRNQISVPTMNLKRRLIQELKNQKEGSSIPGIKTQETVMPIANLLELYHEDRAKEKLHFYDDFDDSSNLKQGENKSDSSTANNCSVTYQSKRYRPFPKKEGKSKFAFDDSSSDEEEKKLEINPEINQESQNEKEDQISIESKSKESFKSSHSEFEEGENEYDYYDEYEEAEDGSGKVKRRKRKSKKHKTKESSRSKYSSKENKESSRSSRKEKSNKKGTTNKHKENHQLSKNKKGSTSTSNNKGSKSGRENELKSGRTKRKRRVKRKLKDKFGNEIENEYEYEYEQTDTIHNNSNNNSLSSSSETSDLENSNRNDSKQTSSISGIKINNEDDLEDDEFAEYNEEEDEDDDEEESSEAQRKKQNSENKIENEEENENENENEEEDSINNRPNAPSSQNRRAANKRKRKGINSKTPFTSGDGSISGLDKLVLSYLNKNLEEEEDQLDLVDIDSVNASARSKTSESKSIIQNKRRLWKPPKFTQVFNPHHPLSKSKTSASAVLKINQPIVIKADKEITPSMRKALHEESSISKILYHNGKTLIKPAQKSLSSLANRPLSNQFLKNSMSSLKSLYISNVEPSFKLDKTSDERKMFDEEQVVSFGGGGRGISEEGLDMQRIRMLRNKQLMSRREKLLLQKQEEEQQQMFSKSYESIKDKNLRKKAKEYEDLSSDFQNLRKVITQLIQMMASSRDDSKEFEILRKRAKFLRKKPAFVGLTRPEKLTPEQFYKQMQKIYMKYTRKKNAHATADDLLNIMKNNLEYAPIILRIIEKTANEERRYIDSKLQRSRLGKQKTEEGMTIHFIDLDWMSNIPDYKNVHLQYREGFDKPDNLDAIVAPSNGDAKNRFSKKGNQHRSRRDFAFSDPSNTVWDRTLAKFELQDLIMISNWVPEELMDEVIADHRSYINRKRAHGNLASPNDNV